jgi:hypothetical protein
MAGRRGLDWDWDGTWPPPGSVLENDRTRLMIEFASDVALRICGPSLRDVAEDVAAGAVWKTVLRLRANAGAVDNLEAYLVRSICNGFNGEVRTRGTRKALAARLLAQSATVLHSPEAKVVAEDEARTVFQRLRRSRPRMKDGDLVLRAHQLMDAGYTQQEAADRLRITRNNLAKKLADYTRAVSDLRREEASEE